MTDSDIVTRGWKAIMDAAEPTIYGLDESFRIVYANEAWDRFARENGAPELCAENGLGMDVLSITPPAIRPFYERFFTSVLETGQAADWLYDCPSDRRYRRFHMHAMRKQGTDPMPALIVTNSLVVETELPSPQSPADFRGLSKANGMISMCCHCRRTNPPDDENSWVFIPELVRRMPPNVSHGICPVCFQLHFARH